MMIETESLGYKFKLRDKRYVHQLNGNSFEKGTTKLFLNKLSDGDTFIDIGGCFGYYTKIGADLVGESGKIITFEPVPENVDVIRKNCENLNNVDVHPIALSNIIGEKTFSIARFMGGGTFNPEIMDKKIGSIQVEVNTLDNFFDITSLDMIKIDAEGEEVRIIEGAISTIKEFRPDLIVEANHLVDFSFIDQLNELNYKFYFINKLNGDIKLIGNINSQKRLLETKFSRNIYGRCRDE